MPKRLELSPHASTQELEYRHRKARDPAQPRRSRGVTVYSLGWVRKIARRYNERDLQGLATAATGTPV
jgi:hypothetical protein